MKKILLMFPVAVLLAVSCNWQQQASNQTAVTSPVTQNTNSTSTTPTTQKKAPSPASTVPQTVGEISDMSISASPSTITLGQHIQIQWSATGATSCSMTESGLTGKASDVSSSKGGVYRTPTITGTITYTIVCKNATGASKTLSANVTVKAVTTPEPAQSAATTLSITSNPAAGNSKSVTAGATNVKLQSYMFSNPTTQSVSVGLFYLNVMASTGSSAFTIKNFKALVNGSLFTNGDASHPEKTNYLVNFMGSYSNTLVIPPGDQITVDIYGDISALPIGTSGTLSLVACNNGYDLTFNYCSNAPQGINLVVQ